MKTKTGFMLALMALALAALACGSGESAPAGEGGGEALSVTRFTLYRDDGSGEAGEEVASFAPSDRLMHFEAQLSAFVSDQPVRWVFTAVDTTEGQNIQVAEVTTDAFLGNILTADLELPNDWPVGTYRADIYVGDAQVGSFEYTVQ